MSSQQHSITLSQYYLVFTQVLWKYYKLKYGFLAFCILNMLLNILKHYWRHECNECACMCVCVCVFVQKYNYTLYHTLVCAYECEYIHTDQYTILDIYFHTFPNMHSTAEEYSQETTAMKHLTDILLLGLMIDSTLIRPCLPVGSAERNLTPLISLKEKSYFH